MPLAPVGHRQQTAANVRGIDPLLSTTYHGGRRIHAHRGDNGPDDGTLKFVLTAMSEEVEPWPNCITRGVIPLEKMNQEWISSR